MPNGISMEFMEYLDEDAQKKKEEKTMFAVHQGRAVLIATVANLLDTKYKLYGFSDDQRDTIN